jgi:hypothetical protein
MATLQASRQWSASSAKARLKQASRERVVPQPAASAPDIVEETTDAYSAPTMVNPAMQAPRSYQGRLSELEQRQLLLQTVTTYAGWHLVSVQHRPESDVLVAYLVRQYDSADPIVAIRDGRALQIIMDAVGDLKVQHPRRQREGLLRRLLQRFRAAFGASDRASSPYAASR